MPFRLLSKSKYLNGLQCLRYLWIACNEPEKIPEPDAVTQNIFDQGHLVGDLAKKLFPGGVDLPTEDFMGNIAMAKELLHKRRPLFEAGVLSCHLYSRVDVLNPTGEDEWDIIEVKSSTSVKEVNLHDVSFQRLCCEDNGMKIRKCFLAYINNQYIKSGEINPEELFIVQDISEEVTALSTSIRDRVEDMLQVIDAQSCPQINIGPRCTNPYECPLTDCWAGLPEHSVFTLYYGGKKSHELYGKGILKICEIPGCYKLNDKQNIQRASVLSGQPHIDSVMLRQFLSSLRYPLYFLDFETINPAVPLFDGNRSYQNIPFQFSLHILREPGGETEHHWHLADGPQDPRPELLERLHEAIGNDGSIVVYNQSFEEGVLRDLGTAFPAYREWSEGIIARLVDLIFPFRAFHYYHPAQKGSTSIKSVLPAVTGSGYESLVIAKGDEASLRYLSITYGTVPEEERLRTKEELLAYCGLDTEGMVRIVERLREVAT